MNDKGFDVKKNWLLGLGLIVVLGSATWFSMQKSEVEEKQEVIVKEKVYAEIFNVLPVGKDVSNKQEIVITFDKEVVPLGAMQRESIDIEITPEVACKWRWLNRSSLACTLERQDKLKLATNYNIRVSKNFSKQDNIELSSAYKTSFSTKTPEIYSAYTILWQAPTKPYIELFFSMPVTKESVLQAFKITSQDLQESFDIDLIEKIVTQEKTSTNVEYKVDSSDPKTAKRNWIISPKSTLPMSAELNLELIGSLYSDEGTLPSMQKYKYTFHTLGEFEFLGVTCQTASGYKLLSVNSTELFMDKNKCDPVEPISLAFSSAVSKKSVAEFVEFNPKLNYLAKSYNPWEGEMDDAYFGFHHHKNKTYSVRLPALIKADAKHTIDAKKMKDIFGRELKGKFEISFMTDNRKPNLTLGYRNIVLEKGVDSHAAVYATNVENIKFDFIRFDLSSTADKKSSSTQSIETMDIKNISYKTKMGIRKALNDKSGVLYGSVGSDSVKHSAGSVLAQVTPFQVHTKFGHFNTLVWVSSFADAKPVENAKVTLYYGSKEKLNNITKSAEEKLTDKDGRALLDGRASLEAKVKQDYTKQFFVHIQKGEDEALLPLNYNYRIYNSDIYGYELELGQHAKFWGTTPQGVYKLGDSVSYKIYHRDQNNTRLIQAIEQEKFNVRVYDPLNALVYQSLDNSLNTFGTMQDSFVIGKKGVSGEYRFEVENKRTGHKWYPMEILVSDFTPAPFRVSTQLDKSIYTPNQEVQISTYATMFSGGAYAHAPLHINAYIEEEPFITNDPLFKDFYFSNPLYNSKTLLDVREDLDAKGERSYVFKLDNVEIPYGSMVVEASVEDDRGKFVSAYAKANYAQKSRFVGLKNTKWVYEKSKPSAVQVVVLNKEKKPIKDVQVDVVVEYKEYRSARVKGSGNAFVTQNSSEWIKDAECSVVSDLTPKECSFVPKNTGTYRFSATIKGTKEKPTEIYGWVSGEGNSVWNQSNDATLEIVPQSNSYKIGERAKYLVKNPFETTEALITIERYGVLDSWVETFNTSTPIVEFEVKEDYLPGFYLSVVALSPRVAKPIGDGVVDLGKPSYKMGYVETVVKDAKKELEVNIKTDKELYKPRDKVTLSIDVKNRLNSKEQDYELAIAVVDASVLALNRQGNKYYDIYNGLNELNSLDVQNFSLISRLIGRQNFEKKGANQGGDGGSDGLGLESFRDDFKYIAYWNPSLEVKSDSSAKVEFTLADNLTEYKVIVLGISKGDSMGNGVSSFKVNKEIQLHPIMPNQILEGDSFEAGFSVLNRTSKKQKLKLSIEAKGAAVAKKNIELDLEAFTREKVYLPLQAKEDGNITFFVHTKGEKHSDALEHTLVVNKKNSLLTMANFGSTTKDEVKETIKVPKDIEANVGTIGLTLSNTVLGNIDGAFEYLKNYPYLCWEQRLSKGLGASNYLSLKEYLDDSLLWQGADENIKEMLKDAPNYQAPNGGMAFWVGANEYVNPYISAYTALGFSWLKESGYEVDFVVKNKLDEYLKSLLSQADLPLGYNKGMSATISGVALHALSRESKIKAHDIQRYFKHYKLMSLFGKAQYFQAMLYTPDLRLEIKEELLDSILAAATQSAAKFEFSETLEDEYVYLLQSPMRTNCSILSALLQAKRVGGYEKKIGDIPPKLMRTITQQRGASKHWENTQDNLFCMQAIKEYTELYESENRSMSLDVRLDAKELAKVEFNSKKDTQKRIEYNIKEQDLGSEKVLALKKEGSGRLYYTSSISYAPKISSAQEINAGFEIHREYAIKDKGIWKLLTPPFKIKRGDIVRVDLYISNASTKHFVVLSDPLAGGFESVNTNLATASSSDANLGSAKMAKGSRWYNLAQWSEYGWYSNGFYHKELREASAEFYADYLSAGNYHLSYTAQAIAAGEFYAMPSHIEQMYDPDVFGKSLPALFIIE